MRPTRDEVVMMRLLMLLLMLCIGPVFTEVYLNKWAVHVPGGERLARDIAERHGFYYDGPIGTLDDYYLLTHHEVSRRSADPSHQHHNNLAQETQVLWLEQQVVKKRVKRDYVRPPDHAGLPASALPFLDPLWDKQWYLHSGATGGYDMNLIPAWKKGYSGKGVVLTILDDGIEHSHPDLQDNYDPDASWDINADDPDPMPKYDNVDTNRHGTRCAGEVAASANNSRCVVGAAFNSNIGGVRMLDGDVSDYVEARSLSLNPQHIDIYSASWGPDDNGKVVDGPAKLAMEAFIKGVLEGRGGKGSIFVWASGNGGNQHDSCNCDGYTNSIFTLSISSASEHGTKPWYLEECSSTLATTYSSGKNYGERKIITTDLHGKCTESHTGTSASAPLAAGICALALEANPDLSWRDMQYIVMMTARPEPLVDGDWITNGVGRKVSHQYGYGLMDAGALVDLAELWTSVPEQHICTTKVMQLDRKIPSSRLAVEATTDGCRDTVNEVRYVEHVQAKISLQYRRRGDLQIFLVSPNGTRTILLQKRQNDKQERDFHDWPFMSVHFWGEQPMGTWTLEMENVGPEDNSGSLFTWQLILYGVDANPVRLKQKPSSPSSHASSLDDTARHYSSEDSITGGMNGNQDGDRLDMPLGDREDWPDRWGYVYGGEDVILDTSCHPECAEEAGCSGDRPEDCFLCRHIRVSSHGPCVASCPEGSYADLSTGQCQRCDAPCETCGGPGLDQCLSCINGFVYIDHQRTCVEQCPMGYMQDEHTGSCTACSDQCLTCASVPHRCTSCRSNHKLVNNHCTMTCLSGQFQREDGSCGTCDMNCDACTGPLSTQCVTCAGSLLLQDGACVAGCSMGFFVRKHPERITCERCHMSCETCNGPEAESCVRCALGFSRAGRVCEAVCPEGSYQALDGSCIRCHDNCRSCLGGLMTQCTACPQGRFLFRGTCITDCPPRFFLKPHDGHAICEVCHATCSECSGVGIGDCTRCDGNRKLQKGQCVTDCAAQNFPTQNACQPCHSNCATCTGPHDTHCITCHIGRVLLEGSCLNECPPVHYVSKHQCRKCHLSCLTCAGSDENDCLDCSPGYSIQDGACVKMTPSEAQACTIGTYWQDKTKHCEVCDSTCYTCRGPGPSNCLKCKPPRKYYVHQHRCVLCCSDGQVEGCCNCHPDTGVCMENRNIDYEENEAKKLRDSSGNAVVAHSLQQHSRGIPGPSKQDTSPVFSVISILVFFCILSVSVFFGVFGVLQARSHNRLCWSHKYQPIPMYRYLQNGNDKLIQMSVDSDEDIEEENDYSA